MTHPISGTAPAGGRWLDDDALWRFGEGTDPHLYRRFGAHPRTVNGVEGVQFTVWAPEAERVSVAGDFNAWNVEANRMEVQQQSGVWSQFVPNVGVGACYKYAIRSRHAGYEVMKADPLAFRAETPPRTASIVWNLDYDWGDSKWMERRRQASPLREPLSIYELHVGSWMRVPEEGNRSLTYRELASRLPDYLTSMGFTHVEFMPVLEHPFYGSWGYQATGFFAPTSRYGTPQDLMFLIDALHQAGIGVILDWVPAHFPGDEHGLAFFDGSHLYEHADPRRGIHPDWDSAIFNYARSEVRGFLLSSAMIWLDVYHVDGIRVDAVASMLYRDYSRKAGEWIPNEFGGREDLDAISLLRKLNEVTHGEYPGCLMIAEESTAWPMVTRPTYVGGLGFDFKWDMGWMHDTLQYLALDPVHRRHHHANLTFRGLYAFTENFVLPLSHDEVVHGKGSLLGKMAGDPWQAAANLRLLFAYMYAQPGKKLLFMGAEFGEPREWDHESSLDWRLLGEPANAGVRSLVRNLNRLHRDEPALHEHDCDPSGFEWIDANDEQQSTVSFLRKSPESGDLILAVCNFTPVPRLNYRVGVPRDGFWQEILNSDAVEHGGVGYGNFGGVDASPLGFHGRPYSLTLTLPPLGAVFLKSSGPGASL